jgi:hypothetical protein
MRPAMAEVPGRSISASVAMSSVSSELILGTLLLVVVLVVLLRAR